MCVCFLTCACYGGVIGNPSFEIAGPGGASVSFTGVLGGGASAAADWLIWNNSAGTTATELCAAGGCGGSSPAPPDGLYAIHVSTDAADSGIVQQFLPDNTGFAQAATSVYLYIVSGTVGFGAGNAGNTAFNATLSTTGQWVLLQVPNSAANTPVNEITLYASGGPAEFFADMVDVQDSAQAVPEPSGMAALGLAGLGLWGVIRRRG